MRGTAIVVWTSSLLKLLRRKSQASVVAVRRRDGLARLVAADRPPAPTAEVGGRAGPRRLRVLMIDSSDRGGIANYTANLVAGLRQHGVDVALCAPVGRALGAPELPHLRWGVQIAGWGPLRRRAATIRSWTARAVTVVYAVRRLDPDIVHLQTAVAGPLDLVFVRWCRRRAAVVRTVHNAIAHQDTRADRREIALRRLVDHVVVHGTAAARVVASTPGRPVHMIPPDLPPEPGPDREAARAALGIGPGPVALVLGLLRPYKGIGLVADAWPGVREQRPDARLVVAGSVPDTFADLDRLLALPGVEARLGWLEDRDVLAWAAAADVVLLPYIHGAHSAVLHRAVVAGTPVLASPALADETARFDAGRVVPLSAPAWTEAIVGALTTALPRPHRAPAGQQAAATVELYRAIRAVRP